MLVVCVDIGSSVGWSIDIERSSINPYTRRGYLDSTLLACRAVARPHIELEICKKIFFCWIKLEKMTESGLI